MSTNEKLTKTQLDLIVKASEKSHIIHLSASSQEKKAKSKSKSKKNLGDEDDGVRLIKDGDFAIITEKPDEDSLREFQTYSKSLFIKDQFLIEPSSVLYKLIHLGLLVPSGEKKIFNGFSYTGYQFFRPLVDKRVFDPKTEKLIGEESDYVNENDCLKFAEAMSIACLYDSTKYDVLSHLASNDSEPVFAVKGTDIKFGESDNVNVSINSRLRRSADIKKDDNAIPASGDVYTIIRDSTKKSQSPYHASFVVYYDESNKVSITLEAEASDNDTEYLPRFSFYDTEPSAFTFHKRWLGTLDEKSRRDALYYNGHTYILSHATTGLPTTGLPTYVPLKKSNKRKTSSSKGSSKGSKTKTNKKRIII
jgi:hypothetical protein